jgi:antitoxin (DNA-binding transcriptional repressor) of toxin-antitoxin stability system
VPDVTATEAARNFADLLDAIEHRHERYTILRRGRAVAQLEPVSRGRGADLKALLRRHEPDTEWADDLTKVRDLLTLDDRG